MRQNAEVVWSAFGEYIGSVCFDGFGAVLGAVVDLNDYFIYETEGFEDGFSMFVGEEDVPFFSDKPFVGAEPDLKMVSESFGGFE